MPIFNADRAVKRLAELQGQLAAAVPAVAAAAPTVAALVSATAADDSVLKITRTELLKLDAATRAELARDGYAIPKADFDRLPIAAKSAWCVAGGKILDDTPAGERSRCTAAQSFGSK